MLNNYIGGGQVFLHKVRMFMQVFSRTAHVALLAGMILTCFLQYSDMGKVDWKGFYSYRKASFTIGWDEAFVDIRASINKDAGRITYINASSYNRSWQNIAPDRVVKMPLFQKANKEGISFLFNSLLFVIWISIGSFLLIVFFVEQVWSWS